MTKRCPHSTVTQSVTFPLAYGVTAAKRWLKKHKLKHAKWEKTVSQIRFRQMPPSKCRKGEYATIPMGKTGISRVICCPQKG